MPVQLQKISLYEAQTQTTLSPSSSKEKLVDELTSSEKYALLSLDEYQIIRTGEEHCLKKYFSDDDRSETNEPLSSSAMKIDDNLNNNASTVLHQSPSDLLDDATHLSAALAQSTSSRISQSRCLGHSKSNAPLDDDDEEEEDDDELDQLVASTFTPSRRNSFEQKDLSSIRQAIESCRENLNLVAELLEHHRSSTTFEHLHQRKVRRSNCLIQMPNSIKGLQYYPSTSVQTD